MGVMVPSTETTFLPWPRIALFVLFFTSPAGWAAEDPAHEELRQLRTNVVEAIRSGDIERQLDYVHTNVVITWQNGEVVRGHAKLREFYERLGEKAFQGYKTPPTPAELTILYGDDTGVSFGDSVAEYTLFGRRYEFNNRWTATLVKENGKWTLASYHVSLDALNNPLINAAKKSLFVAASIAGVIGLFLGVVIGRSLAKAQRPSST